MRIPSDRLYLWKRGVDWISGEHFLEKWPNGGSIIALRSLRLGLIIWLLVTAVEHTLDPQRAMVFSLDELKSSLAGSLPTLGAIFAAVYVALYARFASQWSYLANVYNQIKAAETRIDPGCQQAKDAMSHWKAGFLEDAHTLHLASKPSVAPILVAWGKLPDVRKAFEEDTPGGRHLLGVLLRRAEAAVQHEQAKYPARPESAKSAPGAPVGTARHSSHVIEARHLVAEGGE